MKPKSALALLGCLIATSLPASAAVIVSLNSTAPSGNVLKFNEVTTGTPANITTYWREPGATDQKKSIGQGFSTAGLTGQYSLKAVTFNIFGFSPAVLGLSFNISIYESVSVSAAPSPATLVSSQDGHLPASLTTNDYITFTLGSPVTLSPDKIYNVVYSFTEKTSNSTTVNSLTFKTIGSGFTNTSGGRRWIEVDGTYSASASNGFVFYAQAEAIPEPGAVALLGIGAAALVTFLKRRHA